MKIVARNKMLFASLAAMVLLFNFVLFFGMRRIYGSESEWRHGMAESQLKAGWATIQHLAANFEHHLNFIAGMPAIRGLIEGGFQSAIHKEVAEKIVWSLIEVTPYLFSVMIVDTSGHQRFHVASRQKSMHPVGSGEDTDSTPADSFWKKEALLSIEGTRGIVEIGNPADMKEPLIHLVKPVPDEHRPADGFLVLSMKFAGILSYLADGMFIQTAEGIELAPTPQGGVHAGPARYRIEGLHGVLELSANESIHYLAAEPIPGIQFKVGLRHRHIGLKQMLQRLLLGASALFAAFIGIVGLISASSLRGYREKIRTQKALISSLVELTDFRDPETGRHLERTRRYARYLAEQLRRSPKFGPIITKDFIEDLYDAAPLHDIGKVAIRDAILLKEGVLGTDERKQIETHVVVGGQIMDDIIRRSGTSGTLMQIARNIVKHHHEKHNGRGYPGGLKGAEIPLEARIFALSDVYDALRSRRPYKSALTHEEAAALILSERGQHFDPGVVDAFLAVQEKFAAASREGN